MTKYYLNFHILRNMIINVSRAKTIKSRLKPQMKAPAMALVEFSHSMTPEDLKKKKAVLNRLLTQSLAAYVLLNSRKPMSDVMADLFDLEYKAAQIVAAYFNDDRNVNLRGALAAVYSVIPIGKTPKMVKQKTKATSVRSAKKKSPRK